MLNNFDRLERLFSKRKYLVIQTSPEAFDSKVPKISGLDQRFPQPSFIRPRVSRMTAREERVVASQNERRAQSLPEKQSERISIHISHLSSTSTTTLTLPARAVSLNHRENSQQAASLRGFDFPIPPMGLLPASASCAMSSPKTLPAVHKVSAEHRHSSVILPPRADTPPSSEHEDDSSINNSQVDRPSSALSRDLPTPAASPEMKPVNDDQPQDSADSSPTKRKGAAASRRRREEKSAALRRSHGRSSHRTVTSSGQILKGGDVKDFFALSDDDILEDAESEEAQEARTVTAPLRTPPFPPTPTSTSSSGPSRRTSSIYFDDVAKEGALQAAQIAAKHKFDLVYIVNLWPERPSEYPSSPYRASLDLSRPSGSVRNSLLGPMDGPTVDTAPGMTGRLLAAYGLSNLNNPFRISATVQSKILKHKGWMEYRGDGAQDGEFSRGYGHAFHTATGRRTSAIASPRNSGSHDISQNDRGIVFAAYRYSSKDSATAGCTKDELEALRADAEGLVDYLVAIHKARRLKDPMGLQTLADE